MNHMDGDEEECSSVLHIHWEPSKDDYVDLLSSQYDGLLFQNNYTIIIGLFLVSEVKYVVKVTTHQSNSLKRKSSGHPYGEVTVTLQRSSVRVPYKALNVQGILFFVQDETHKKLACKSFRYALAEDELSFSFEMDVTEPASEKGFYIQGHIIIDYPSDPDQAGLSHCPSPVVHKLSEDFQYLLDENPFSDITLKCGDVNIPSHRNILASRSPVFKAMLRKTTQESQTGAIQIEDIHPDTVRAMLKYIYCARTGNLSETSACALLYAANKYELLDLKQMCVAHLKSVISNDNFFRILDAAVAHDEDLKLVVIEYIGKNFTEIEHSADWGELKKQNPELVMDIRTKIVKFN
ncbi:hypothetical protein JTE90_005294 [Oedothorax gibbosus]|uniref:BTB domain-containing protein n=1 Tax=Oedothorax gibbosus TaxID=931172 RepID=A0AAV6U468_9ARAC|nr:hypothetical protein JTE90_005294 [Oedothorax gibbosus]